MALALHSRTIVDDDHGVTVRAPELIPGASVEVIVLMEPEAVARGNTGTSFLDAVEGVTIDAPPDYSTRFETALYANPGDA